MTEEAKNQNFHKNCSFRTASTQDAGVQCNTIQTSENTPIAQLPVTLAHGSARDIDAASTTPFPNQNKHPTQGRHRRSDPIGSAPQLFTTSAPVADTTFATPLANSAPSAESKISATRKRAAGSRPRDDQKQHGVWIAKSTAHEDSTSASHESSARTGNAPNALRLLKSPDGQGKHRPHAVSSTVAFPIPVYYISEHQPYNFIQQSNLTDEELQSTQKAENQLIDPATGATLSDKIAEIWIEPLRTHVKCWVGSPKSNVLSLEYLCKHHNFTYRCGQNKPYLQQGKRRIYCKADKRYPEQSPQAQIQRRTNCKADKRYPEQTPHAHTTSTPRGINSRLANRFNFQSSSPHMGKKVNEQLSLSHKNQGSPYSAPSYIQSIASPPFVGHIINLGGEDEKDIAQTASSFTSPPGLGRFQIPDAPPNDRRLAKICKTDKDTVKTSHEQMVNFRCQRLAKQAVSISLAQPIPMYHSDESSPADKGGY